MLDARIILFLLPALLPLTSPAKDRPDEISVAESVTWLEQEAHRGVRASMRRMNDSTAAFPPQVGIGYDAFWLRDYEYTLEGTVDAYADEELLAACRLFVRSMRADGAGEGWDRCPYGFTDTSRKQGGVLSRSLLFVQACRQLPNWA